MAPNKPIILTCDQIKHVSEEGSLGTKIVNVVTSRQTDRRVNFFPNGSEHHCYMMVQAWFMDSSDEDQRLPHQLDPPQPVSLEDLKNCGVLYWKLDADNFEKEGKLAEIREERGYSYSDCITCTPERLPNYEQKIKSFFEEHLHTDEEIRFIMDGSGYFDIRNYDDRWIRIFVEKGDLIILPAGIYHRFTLDDKNYIKAMRLFIGEPVWTPHNRPADDLPARSEYLKNMQAGIFSKA